MNPVARTQISEAIEAMQIEPGGEPRWLGRPIPLDPWEPRGRGSADSGRLAAVLYAGWYCRGGRASNCVAPPIGAPGLRRHVLVKLAARVPCRHRWEEGWRVRERHGDRLVVRKDQLDLWVGSDECRAVAGGVPVPGSAVRVRVPADRWDAAPGFLLVLGRKTPRSTTRRTRVYLNLDLEGAGALLAATGAWNKAGLAFAIKVAADPTAYERCDTSVVYIARRDFDDAWAILLQTAHVWRPRLRQDSPALARRLGPGVAVADDPTEGGSFGLLRCRQIAEGLLRAHSDGAPSLEERMRAVEERLTEDGVPLNAMHLERGGVEYDAMPWEQ
jgi:hypothetical protein